MSINSINPPQGPHVFSSEVSGSSSPQQTLSELMGIVYTSIQSAQKSPQNSTLFNKTLGQVYMLHLILTNLSDTGGSGIAQAFSSDVYMPLYNASQSGDYSDALQTAITNFPEVKAKGGLNVPTSVFQNSLQSSVETIQLDLTPGGGNLSNDSNSMVEQALGMFQILNNIPDIRESKVGALLNPVITNIVNYLNIGDGNSTSAMNAAYTNFCNSTGDIF